MQTSYEVIDALMKGRPAERYGVTENIWKDTLRKWIGQGYPTDTDGTPVDAQEHFDLDFASAGGKLDWHPLRGFEEVVEETNAWHLLRNGSGAVLKFWKNKSGTPEHMDFRMTAREIWDAEYRPHLLHLDPARFDLESYRIALQKSRNRKKYVRIGNQFIWENMRQSMGDVCMYESLLTDPEWVQDYCRVYTDFYKMHYAYLFDHGGTPDDFRLCEDLGYKNGLFCSPRVLETLIFPYFAELVEFFHGYGVNVTLHSCGGIKEALPLIVQAGFDALDPMERKAGCDPLEFARIMENKLVLIGGNDVRLFESGDRHALRKAIEEQIQALKDHGVRYVFMSDHSISTSVDYDDYRYALAVYRQNRML